MLRRARALLALAVLAAALAPPARADTGGATAPVAGAGGAGYGQAPARTHDRRPRARGPLLQRFVLTRPQVFLFGRPGRIEFRIASRSRTVMVRLYVLPAGSRRALYSIPLGARRAGASQSYLFTGREAGILPQGRYVVRIAARDRRGRPLRASASASRSAELGFYHHRFPIAGPFSYGDGFGVPRPGHAHQGQDLPAPEGTPVVAPRGGVIKAVEYQAGGAGNYVVLGGEAEDRDYVFMHLSTESVRVVAGQRVRTGQRIGDVGSTGDATGPHLHFEVWVGGGWYTGGHPIDPLPLLRAWDGWS